MAARLGLYKLAGDGQAGLDVQVGPVSNQVAEVAKNSDTLVGARCFIGEVDIGGMVKLRSHSQMTVEKKL